MLRKPPDFWGRKSKTKAAVFYSPGVLKVEEREIPEPDGEEIVVQPAVSGLCPTDVKIYRNGSSSVKPPVVLGHEFSGFIHSVGDEITHLQKGDSVAVAPDVSCGKCSNCKKGQMDLCRSALNMGYNVDGAHADYVRLPARYVQGGAVFKLDKVDSFDELALTEPLACSLHSIESVGIKPGKSIVVIGDGPMALLHVSLAKVYGADEIVVIGIDRLETENC